MTAPRPLRPAAPRPRRRGAGAGRGRRHRPAAARRGGRRPGALRTGEVAVVDDSHGALTLGAVALHGARDVRVAQDLLVGERALARNAERTGLTGTYRSVPLAEAPAGARVVLVKAPRALDALREIAEQVAAVARARRHRARRRPGQAHDPRDERRPARLLHRRLGHAGAAEVAGAGRPRSAARGGRRSPAASSTRTWGSPSAPTAPRSPGRRSTSAPARCSAGWATWRPEAAHRARPRLRHRRPRGGARHGAAGAGRARRRPVGGGGGVHRRDGGRERARGPAPRWSGTTPPSSLPAGSVDLVVCNPPFHVGAAVVTTGRRPAVRRRGPGAAARRRAVDGLQQRAALQAHADPRRRADAGGRADPQVHGDGLHAPLIGARATPCPRRRPGPRWAGMTDIPMQGGPPALGDRLLAAVIGAFEAAAVDLGDRLGWYRALAGTPATAAGAGRAHRHPSALRPRVARAAGRRRVPDGGRRARPPTGAATRSPTSTAPSSWTTTTRRYATPLARLAMTFTRNVPRLAEVYRSGGGLSWAEMGPEAREGQAAANRPFFVGPLVGEVFPALPEVDAVLRAGDGSPTSGAASAGPRSAWRRATRRRGWTASTSTPSLEQARRNAAAAGVADRVRFTAADAGGLAAAGDVRPGDRLRVRARPARPGRRPLDDAGAGRPDGTCWWWTSGSPRPSPRPATRWNGSCTATASPAASRMRCPPSRPAATGTVMRPSTLPATPGRPASRGWRCWRSTTTSSGSTGCGLTGSGPEQERTSRSGFSAVVAPRGPKHATGGTPPSRTAMEKPDVAFPLVRPSARRQARDPGRGGCGALGIFAVVSLQALSGTGETAEELLASAEGTEDVLLADMMHDAVRGDVLQALVSGGRARSTTAPSPTWRSTTRCSGRSSPRSSPTTWVPRSTPPSPRSCPRSRRTSPRRRRSSRSPRATRWRPTPPTRSSPRTSPSSRTSCPGWATPWPPSARRPPPTPRTSGAPR